MKNAGGSKGIHVGRRRRNGIKIGTERERERERGGRKEGDDIPLGV